jgi:hypothetical protein
MEDRSSRRMRTLLTRMAQSRLSGNGTACALISAKEVVMLRKAMTIIVLATAVALGGTALSTAALARGGGFSGGHFGGGHVGRSYGGGHMFGRFGGFHGGHEHGELRHGFGGYGYSPYYCDYSYRSHYTGCY